MNKIKTTGSAGGFDFMCAFPGVGSGGAYSPFSPFWSCSLMLRYLSRHSMLPAS